MSIQTKIDEVKAQLKDKGISATKAILVTLLTIEGYSKSDIEAALPAGVRGDSFQGKVKAFIVDNIPSAEELEEFLVNHPDATDYQVSKAGVAYWKPYADLARDVAAKYN